MRILANENIPGDVVELLRAAGNDVAWVRTDAPGSTDEANLARAVADRRILITFDKDFGDLVFRRRQKASCGVVLFRFRTPSPAATAAKAAAVLASREDWADFFSVVDQHRVRMIPLRPQ